MYKKAKSLDAQQKLLVESIQKQCLNKGTGGIKGLSTMFRAIDRNFSSGITVDEFFAGMKRYGISMSDEDLVTIFQYFDKDRNGTIDFREFLQELRPPLSQRRRDVIDEAFEKIDVVQDGVLKLDDLKIVYKKNAEQHPKYKSGEWTLEEVMQYFLDTFDDPNDKDGVVTMEEFVNYYCGVSSIIDQDEYFDLMMRSCWGLAPSRKASARPANRH